MKSVVFVTANQSKHGEVQRLLAGLDVRWARLDLARPDTTHLEAIARARAAEAYRRLGEACFLENTGLFLDRDASGAPGASFKREWRELGEEGFAARYGGSRGIARVVVALAEGPDPAAVQLFNGSISGELLRAPRGEGQLGWDRLWVPDGYDRTLGELAASAYVVNMRALPYLELGDHLRGRTTPGTFEAHVTVSARSPDVEPFRAACAELGVKCISIELPEGETRAQPMTGSFHRGELLEVQQEVVALARELVRRGFEVTRTKIEAHGRLDWTPATDEEAMKGPTTSYFEFHTKLALPAGEDLAPLVARFKALGAHLSRNAHKPAGADGLAEHFVTVRAHRVGRLTAEARFQAFCDEIERQGYVVRNRIREYTVFDTNVELDRGWIESVSDDALRAVMLGWIRRVARSAHRDRLVLRGSLLTSTWCPGRSAADVDHLVIGGFSHDEARALVDELLAAPDPSVSFDVSTTEHAVIWAETPSPGLRTKVLGRDAAGRTAVLQVDLGQGDHLVHAPVPVSIDGNPEVLGVTPETMFGWKTDGLFEFGHGSWRAKDLYDLWLIDRHVALVEEALVVAVGAAFEHQGMDLSVADRFLFTDAWGASRGSRRRWESFGRRSGLAASSAGLPDLAPTIAHVRARLRPIFAALGHTAPAAPGT